MNLIGLSSACKWVCSGYRACVGQCIPTDMPSWTMPDQMDLGGADAVIRERAGVWLSLSPFFARHGYHLYNFRDRGRGYSLSPPIFPRPCQRSFVGDHPWPWRLWEHEHELDFTDLRGCRLWPARSSCGREVMIRMVSGPITSEELRVYQRLNAKHARGDHRNHTLPVLEYLTLSDFVFVALPRWQNAFECDSDVMPFKSASEIFHAAETFYEGLSFLHDNCISHGDIAGGNMVINALLGTGNHGIPDARALSSVRYAYIDWDAARVFASGTDIASVRVCRDMRRPVVQLGLQRGLCNPFKDDVRCLTNALQRWVRVLDVPALGEFFDGILNSDDEHLPLAHDCLESLRQIRLSLTPSALAQSPKFVFWCNGYLKPMHHPYSEDASL